MDARALLERMGVVIDSAKKLAIDPLFINCLNEEIAAYWQSNSNLNEGKVVFSVDSSGDTIYEGTMQNCTDSAKIIVDIQREVKQGVSESQVKEFQQSAGKLIETLKDTNSVLVDLQEMKNIKELGIQAKRERLLDKLLAEKK